MFKKIFLLLLYLQLFVPRVFADEVKSIEPVIKANSNVEINKSIIFDASSSVIPENVGQVTYEWYFGDGNRQQGSEVVHSYASPGEYEVTLVIRPSKGDQVTIVQKIFAYKSSFALITDVESEKDRVVSFVDSAKNEGIFVDLINNYTDSSEFLAEESLQRKLLDNLTSLAATDTIVIWTNGSSGLTVLSQMQKSLSEQSFFKNKKIIFISEQNFGSLKNIAKGTFVTIRPAEILLTRQEAVWVLLETNSLGDLEGILSSRAIQYEIVNDKLNVKIWNFMSYFVNSMIQKGVPSNTISLVLMLPVIVTVVAFMKQVVGATTLGVYTPSILALSFIALDLGYGLLILFVILIFGMFTRSVLKRYRLLYIPRMAIVLTIVSLTILFLLFLGSYFNISQIVGVAVFPMLIMSTLVEKFVSLQSGKGLKSAVFIIAEAVSVAILAYFIAEWSWLKVSILGHPEIIFLFLLANIFLGRWAGLRVSEYLRFREIIRHAEEE